MTRLPACAGRWEARIGIPGSKHIYLGLYEVESDAARAYDSALVRLRGSTASTNFPQSECALLLWSFNHGACRVCSRSPCSGCTAAWRPPTVQARPRTCMSYASTHI